MFRFESITLTYDGKRRALDDVSLSLEPGEIVALVGNNGAGKTTLMRVGAAALIPRRGRIALDGHVVTRDAVALRRRIALVHDMPLAYGNWTALEHAAAVLDLYGKADAETSDMLLAQLERLGSLEYVDVRIATLSRGEMYKVCLAPLLVCGATVYFFDEPFASGMDPRGIEELERAFERLKAGGACVVYSTQWIDHAAAKADRIVVLEGAKIAADEQVPRTDDARAEGLARLRAMLGAGS